jgi:hypothetical protein
MFAVEFAANSGNLLLLREKEKAGKTKNFIYNPDRLAALTVPDLQLGCRNINDRFGRLINEDSA